MSDFNLMIYFRIERFDTILAAVTVGYSQHGTIKVGQNKKRQIVVAGFINHQNFVSQLKGKVSMLRNII